MTKRVNIIGCGHLGKTLGHLWHSNNTLSIGQVFNRSAASTAAAVQFIGGGQACTGFKALTEADLWLISSADNAIAECANQLANLPLQWSGKIVLHCSGAHASNLLKPLQNLGAQCASVHPLHSFANPAASINKLKGCYCSAEGDLQALDVLQPLFESLGLKWLTINASEKLLYHAAAVFACNYLTTIMDAAERCLQATTIGQNQAQALPILMPLIQQTLANIEHKGVQQSLSGPVKRGEAELIQHQLASLWAQDQNLGQLYQSLAHATLPLAGLDSQALQRVLSALQCQAPHPSN